MKQNEKPVICVIGMGYVGLPLAAVAANKGYEVYGFDLLSRKNFWSSFCPKSKSMCSVIQS